MIPHLKKSRVVKALTDRRDGGMAFDVAESCLSHVHVAVVISQDEGKTASGQAAALTAIVTASKCFGTVSMLCDAETILNKPLPIGHTLGRAAEVLGAVLVAAIPPSATHVIYIGQSPERAGKFVVRCWWDGWLAGVMPAWDERNIGRSGNPLAGVFAGALAVREVFASVLGYSRAGTHISITSIWEPEKKDAGSGPTKVYMPSKLWFIGLGHLGQGFLWNIGLLPVDRLHAVLQDDQTVGVENEATGLITSNTDVGERKTRVAAKWLEGAGWTTSLIERRHYGDIRLIETDPPIVMTGLDEPKPRIDIAKSGFPWMIDAGVGHNSWDFESLQIRLLKCGDNPLSYWSQEASEKDIPALLENRAYKAHSALHGNCGTVTLAQASVAVPFVGAATGALAVAQAIRLACMLETTKMMRMELGSADMVIASMRGPALPVDGTAMIGTVDLHM